MWLEKGVNRLPSCLNFNLELPVKTFALLISLLTLNVFGNPQVVDLIYTPKFSVKPTYLGAKEIGGPNQRDLKDLVKSRIKEPTADARLLVVTQKNKFEKKRVTLSLDFKKLGESVELVLFSKFTGDSILHPFGESVEKRFNHDGKGIFLCWSKRMSTFTANIVPCYVWLDGFLIGSFESNQNNNIRIVADIIKKEAAPKTKKEFVSEVAVKVFDGRDSIIMEFITDGMPDTLISDGRHGLLMDGATAFRGFKVEEE